MVRELDKLGIKVMVSVWPTVNPDSENYAELERRNLLVRTERGMNTFIRFTDTNAKHTVISHLLDSTHPEARKFLWNKLRENYHRHGIKVWWLDAIEPEMVVYDHDNVRYHAGNGLEVGCLYPDVPAAGVVRGHEVGGRNGNHHARPRGIRRQPAVRRGDLVRRYSLDVGGFAAAGPRRAEHRVERHSVVDHRHRRLFRRRD